MESVMVYGVVILIVMLAIGALIKFGVFDLSSILPEQCDLQGQLQCDAYSVQSAGAENVQLELKNIIGKNIEISEIKLYGEDDTKGLWGEDFAGCLIQPSETTGTTNRFNLNNDAKSTYKLTCNIGLDVGKKIDGKIKVMYKTVGSDIQSSLIGDIRVTIMQGQIIVDCDVCNAFSPDNCDGITASEELALLPVGYRQECNTQCGVC